ncbi:hypothetical protein I6A84_16280 [Frankia sp. CNm7]|uniref:ATP synthase protein I n=1 Tax=Frankia nepalensis TaxID=1836974 RepID=A0A937RHS6_9ACTN|nr:hypothetical protein [Frankia nepalensis]MBL7510902.1 hypothetical protein [Frankia nepalensis]MBL7519614.1 hypothetical protein [Frankia nepalensis]MBL7630402.1 hypothetical protein [Frankia nepalensis]
MATAPVIRLGAAVSAAVAVPAVALGAAVKGWPGAYAALLGIGVVVAFFSISKIAVGFVGRRAPHLLLPAALGTYLVKIALLGVLLVSLSGVEAIHLLTLAWTVFAGVFGWIGAEMWVATHTRVPFFDPAAFASRHPAPADPGASARGAAGPGAGR